jgi:hypothetical protein
MNAESDSLKSQKVLESGSRHKVKVAKTNLNKFGMCLDRTLLLYIRNKKVTESVL